MKLAVFVGPSLSGWVGPAWLGEARRPPIRRGDLGRLPDIDAGGWVVAVVDGEFGQSLAVTVAEIRDVLRAGNVVIGGASMGALRAVECEPLGMRSVGWIAEQYRRGAIWADAEVALCHLPEDHGYRPLTVPLINLRWIVERVMALPRDRAADLLEACRRVHFRDRTPARVVAALHEVDDGIAALIDEHLTAGNDRKRLDAVDVVAAARAAWLSSGAKAGVGPVDGPR